MKALLASLLLAVVVAAAAVVGVRRRGLATGRVLPSLLRALALLAVLLGADEAFAGSGGAAGAADAGAPDAGPGASTKRGESGKPTSSSLPLAPVGAREIGTALAPAQEWPARFDVEKWAPFSPSSGRSFAGSRWALVKAELARVEALGTGGSGGADDDASMRATSAATARRTAAELPESFRKLLPDENGRFPAAPASAASAAAAAAALEDMEEAGAWDAWLAAYVWRRSAGAHDAALLARIERHLRVAHALLLATRATGPVSYVPWMKKSAAPRDYRDLEIPADFVATARRLFPSTDAATWESDGALTFRVVKAGPVARLHRRGAQLPLTDGAELRLRRLDIAHADASAPLVLEHPTLGRIEIAPGRSLTSWTLPQHLSPNARGELAALVNSALAGAQPPLALKKLEPLVPAAHLLIREALAREPNAKGAPALRMLLTSFDE